LAHHDGVFGCFPVLHGAKLRPTFYDGDTNVFQTSKIQLTVKTQLQLLDLIPNSWHCHYDGIGEEHSIHTRQKERGADMIVVQTLLSDLWL